MGGSVRIMLTGSAPLDPHMLERMRAFFCCTIVEVRTPKSLFEFCEKFTRIWSKDAPESVYPKRSLV